MSFSGRSIASTNGSTRLASIDIPVCWPLINRYVYEQLPPRVLEKLQELNPVTAKRISKTQHDRHFADTANSHLDKQVTSNTR